MDYKKFIEECGAILDAKKTGEHYVGAFGRHMGIYIEKRRLLSNPWTADILGNELAQKVYEHYGDGVDIFLGAQTGGAKFANYVALSYLDKLIFSENTRDDVLCLEAEKKYRLSYPQGCFGGENRVCEPFLEEDFKLSEEYERIIKGRTVCLVENTINTGGTLLRLLDLTYLAGGRIAGIVAIWNRGNFNNFQCFPTYIIDSIYPSFASKPTFLFQSLVDEGLESWSKDECPLCKEGVPISKKYGHGGK